jgi:cob(I)alamin adenosyltransferase
VTGYADGAVLADGGGVAGWVDAGTGVAAGALQAARSRVRRAERRRGAR